jgi:hypothetical protein
MSRPTGKAIHYEEHIHHPPEDLFIAGWKLLERRPWARTLAIVVAIVALPNPILGTVLGILYTLGVVALGCRVGVAARDSRGVVPMLFLGSLCWWRDVECLMNSTFGSERLFLAL